MSIERKLRDEAELLGLYLAEEFGGLAMEKHQLCVWWTEEGVGRNSDLFTFEELAKAISDDAFVGMKDIHIELRPLDGDRGDFWNISEYVEEDCPF